MPGVHLGPEATALERQGTRSYKGDDLREAHLEDALARFGATQRKAVAQQQQRTTMPVAAFLMNQVQTTLRYARTALGAFKEAGQKIAQSLRGMMPAPGRTAPPPQRGPSFGR